MRRLPQEHRGDRGDPSEVEYWQAYHSGETYTRLKRDGSRYVTPSPHAATVIAIGTAEAAAEGES